MLDLLVGYELENSIHLLQKLLINQGQIWWEWMALEPFPVSKMHGLLEMFLALILHLSLGLVRMSRRWRSQQPSTDSLCTRARACSSLKQVHREALDCLAMGLTICQSRRCTVTSRRSFENSSVTNPLMPAQLKCNHLEMSTAGADPATSDAQPAHWTLPVTFHVQGSLLYP